MAKFFPFKTLESKLYGVDATIIIFVFVLYCIQAGFLCYNGMRASSNHCCF